MQVVEDTNKLLKALVSELKSVIRFVLDLFLSKSLVFMCFVILLIILSEILWQYFDSKYNSILDSLLHNVICLIGWSWKLRS